MQQFQHKHTKAIVTVKGRVAKALDDNPRYEPVGGTADAGPFDPSKHGVAKVLEQIQKSDDVEKARIVAAEVAGKNRPGIVGQS